MHTHLTSIALIIFSLPFSSYAMERVYSAIKDPMHYWSFRIKEKEEWRALLALWENQVSDSLKILDNRIDYEFRNNHSQTLLHLAARNEDCHQGIMSFLLDKGADVNRQSNNGMTPLHLAIIYRQEKKALALLNTPGIDVNLENNAGLTALDFAMQKGEKDLCEVLEQKRAFSNRYFAIKEKNHE